MASQDELDEKCSQIVDLELTLEETVDALEQKANELEVLEIQASRMRSTIQNLEASRKSREREIDAVRFDAEQEKSRLEEQLSRLKKANDGMIQELMVLHGQMVTTQGSSGTRASASIGAASQDSCGQCDDLKVQLEATNEKLAQQYQQLETDSYEKLYWQQQIEDFQSKYAPRMLAIEAAKVITERDSDRLKKRLGDLEQDYEVLLREAAVLRGQLLATEELADGLQASTSQASCGQCSDLQDLLEETREQLTQRYAQLEAVSSEKLQLQQQMDNFAAKQNSSALASEAAKFVAEKDGVKLKKRVGDLEKENGVLRKEISIVRDQLEGIQKDDDAQADASMTVAKLKSEMIFVTEALRAKEEEIRRLTEDREISELTMSIESEEQQAMQGTQRMLYSATTGLVVGMILKCCIK